jgi:hypothetical protein
VALVVAWCGRRGGSKALACRKSATCRGLAAERRPACARHRRSSSTTPIRRAARSAATTRRSAAIAAERIIHVRFTPGHVMSVDDFTRVQAVIDAKVGADVQAFALAWTLPYRVECMSVTAAFALGFDPGSYCAEGCQPTKASPYFNSRSSAPFTDHRVRPSMLLAGSDVESAKRLIDRGLRSDDSWPEGKAYLMNTSDRSRNVRAESYERVIACSGRHTRSRRSTPTRSRARPTSCSSSPGSPRSPRSRATGSSTARSPTT